MSLTRSQFKQELDQAIDYRQVLEQIASNASFSSSKEAIEQAMPKDSLSEAKEELAYVEEAIEFVRLGKVCSLGGISDILPEIKAAQKGIRLLPSELMQVALFLSAVEKAIHSFDEELEPLLYDLVQTMDPCIALRKEIDAKIDLGGEVKENATASLYNKIQTLRSSKADFMRYAKQYVRKHADRLMDTTTTSMQGRVCVLAKAGEKNSFHGLIHGASQSGLASYVEPAEFVSYNNKIQSLESQIDEEKKKICLELSQAVAKKALALRSDLETITFLDTILARAQWAYRIDGCIPRFQTRDHALMIENGRHPLLDPKKAVANTYELKSNQYCLMVSGPNMGGKTVTLKTIGLFVVLAHAGFPVGAHQAKMPWYSSMWFDIGDNQSIANNLSTFSSHISKIAKICSYADEHTFILLDEIGNGTDPVEGASLAASILADLIHKKSTIITSTHYDQVKEFGKTQPNTLVSSVEFDIEALKPTYRYLPGISGGSYAFAIAQQLHLADSIIQNARQFKEENTKESQKMLERLEKEQTKVLKKQEKFDELIKQAHQVQKEADEIKASWKKKKEKLDSEYALALDQMVEEKKAQARDLLKNVQTDPNYKLSKHAELMSELNALVPEQKREKEAKEVFKVGDYVHISSLNAHGEILELRKKQATVLSNGMKVNVKVNTLSKMARPQPKAVLSRPKVESVATRFPLELNLIGMRVEEGLQALDHYLDQAIVHKAISVRIIHGMGTGKLRAAIWNDLQKRNTIKSFASGGPSEGGMGATIVNFK